MPIFRGAVYHICGRTSCQLQSGGSTRSPSLPDLLSEGASSRKRSPKTSPDTRATVDVREPLRGLAGGLGVGRTIARDVRKIACTSRGSAQPRRRVAGFGMRDALD